MVNVPVTILLPDIARSLNLLAAPMQLKFVKVQLVANNWPLPLSNVTEPHVVLLAV